jgi:RNA polymerase sigma-70 factor (ECF subfamily)
MKVSERRVLVLDPSDERAAGAEGDELLVVQSREGDAASFASLYHHYREEVYLVCLRRLHDPALAEDVVQDTFIRAYANLDRFNERRRFLPWLITIAKRRCIDIRRLDARTETREDLDTPLRIGGQVDSTLDAVIAGEERKGLERALRRLNPRQRRAMLLHAIEGWSCADIASAEGITVTATKSLLFHARKNLRRSCRRGALGTFAFPLIALRRRVRTLHDRTVARIGEAQPLFGTASSSLAQGITALVVAVATFVGASQPAAVGKMRAALSSVRPSSMGSHASKAGSGPASGHGNKVTVPLTQPLQNPTAAATPDNTQFSTVAVSPNYGHDHTLIAAGSMPCAHNTCAVLFVSHDGGATWTNRSTRGFAGAQIVLPPSYPADPRIFAMGPAGLQVSKDEGASFEPVVPLQGELAISPLFDRADHSDARILIGASTVTEYWPDTNLVQFKPATLIGPSGTWLTLAFSPAYASDKTLFVGGIRPDTAGVMRPAINRCADTICNGAVFTEGFDAPGIRTSPDFALDGTVYGFTADRLFRSVDGGKSFTTLAPTFARANYMRDLLVTRDGSVFAAVVSTSKANDLYWSSDGGRTWIGRRIPFAGFREGTSRIVETPDGHLIAVGLGSGVACSVDGGRTWTARCPG